MGNGWGGGQEFDAKRDKLSVTAWREVDLGLMFTELILITYMCYFQEHAL